jgi:catechol-2,3-dioxygenase
MNFLYIPDLDANIIANSHRKLKATWSLEAAEDMMNFHGIDSKELAELANQVGIDFGDPPKKFFKDYIRPYKKYHLGNL